MRRTKQQGYNIAGDWSTTGTFLRKPSGGWLHEDRELQNGLSVNYSVQYLGSVMVTNSMRTLQFNTRTQVTKEAILRLAENSGNVFTGKKKKVPKQVDKVLGAFDTRWAGEVNLSVSVESLKISDEVGGVVRLNHSLPSISFASGGDGATADYIGYVAKDPVHGRACHVFECPRTSQFVLATIGQAFELRYKMYLNSPRSSVQPLDVASGWDSDAWGNMDIVGRVVETTADIHHPMNSPKRSVSDNDIDAGGIYSDIPDLPPPESTPPPVPTALYTLAEKPTDNGHGYPPIAHPRLENPYDTMEINVAGTPGIYPGSYRSNLYEEGNFTSSVTSSAPSSAPGKVRLHEEGSEYSSTFISIRQSQITDSLDHIPLTHPSAPETHDYSNIDYSNIEPKDRPIAKKRISRPLPNQPSQNNVLPGDTAAIVTTEGLPDYDIHGVEKILDYYHNSTPPKPNPRVTQNPLKNKPPLKKKPIVSHTRSGTYDDPDEVIAATKKVRPKKPSREGIVDGMLSRENGVIYDDPEEGSAYNTPEGVYDSRGRNLVKENVVPSPKFDDHIYMDAASKGGAGEKHVGLENMAPVANSLPDPLRLLTQQNYFHGPLSRIEAEAMLVSDGEFLIRESVKKPGQYVLTGMAAGKVQHLLLMDKQGKVKSKDREFESVPHLIRHFTESKLPLIIGNSQVFLQKPVINAFLT